jgi:hypothetical protein
MFERFFDEKRKIGTGTGTCFRNEREMTENVRDGYQVEMRISFKLSEEKLFFDDDRLKANQKCRLFEQIIGDFLPLFRRSSEI